MNKVGEFLGRFIGIAVIILVVLLVLLFVNWVLAQFIGTVLAGFFVGLTVISAVMFAILTD